MTRYSAPLDILLDAETRIVAIDALLAARLGHRAETLPGTTFGALVDPDDIDLVGAALVDVVLERDTTASAACSLHTAEGAALAVTLDIAGRHSEVDGFVGFNLTVTLEDGALPTLPDNLQRLALAAALVDSTGTVIDANDAWRALFRSDHPGPNLLDHLQEADHSALTSALERVENGTLVTVRADYRCDTRNGLAWCRISLSGIDETPGLVTVTAEDISAEQLATRALVANESLFRSLAEASPVGIARLAPDLSITYASPSWVRLTGSTDGAPSNLADALHPEGRERVLVDLRDRLADESDHPVRARLSGVSEARWVNLRVSTVHDDELGPVGFVATVEDITELIVASESQSQLAGVVESTSDLVGIADLRTGQLLYLNAAAQALFAPSGDLDDVHVAELYSVAERSRYLDEVYPVLRRGDTWTGELVMLRHDGTTVRVLQTVAAEIGTDGEPERASVLGRDVSDERAVLEELAYKATHDHLTGLPNRSLLVDHLELALARSARDRTPVAVLFIDLDRFKAVNDTHGHDVGDLLLQEISARMSTVLRPSDTVARLGGDEFVIVCDDIEGEMDAVTIAGRIRAAIEDEPIVLEGASMDISASIGIAMSNGGSLRDPETLLKRADTAMYRAKEAGRARTEIFDEAVRDRTRRRTEMGAQLQSAIETEELELYYQPMVDLVSGRVAAVEAFVRWNHRHQGLLTPSEFLDIAVEAGLEQSLDRVVIDQACAEAKRWHNSLGDASPPVHVNVAGRSLLAGTLSQQLDQCLRATGLPPNKLVVELSERFLMNNGEANSDRLEQVRALGVQLCIDDVGTGATVLTRLSRYQLHILKVDGSLLPGMIDDESVRQLVGGVIALGRALGLTVAVEAVEDQTAIPILRRLGANLAQGHVFSPPLPAGKLEPLLSLRSTIARA